MSSSFILFGIVLPWLVVAMMVAASTWIGYQVIQQNGRLLGRLDGLEQRLSQLQLAPPAMAPGLPQQAQAPEMPASLPIGSPAPAFELPDLAGNRKSLADFRGKMVLLIFFNPGCGFCSRMAPDLAGLAVDGREGKPIPVLITTGDAEENRRLFAEHGVLCPALLQKDMEVAGQYQCHGTPMGYLIDEQGRIASEMAVGAPALLDLAEGSDSIGGTGQGVLGGNRTVADSKIARDGLAAGTPAPAFVIPRLAGGELSLEQYRGQKLLLVFSDPNCGPCDELTPRIEEASHRSDSVQVAMVSRGDEEVNRAKAAEKGLTFPIGLQRQWEISRQYAMFATPIAYLIDENSVIAADVAIGVEPILAILNGSASKPISGRRPDI